MSFASGVLGANQECRGCGARLAIWDDVCGRCGARMFSQASLRKRGVVLAILGLALACGMGYLIWLIAEIMRHTGEPGAKTRFSGSTFDAVWIFAVLLLVFSFSLGMLVGGIWKIRYGRRHKGVVRMALVMGVLLVGGSMLLDVLDLVETVRDWVR